MHADNTPFPGDHRPWPTPDSPWLVWMSWRKLLFAHWPVDPELVRPHIPDGLQLDTRDGSAWIGVVPFDMVITPRAMPRFGNQSHFLELNVRTYVREAGTADTNDPAAGKPGVFFFSLDAQRWLAVRAARRLFHLPYFDADMAVERGDRSVRYRSKRTHGGVESAVFDARYTTDRDTCESEPGTLEHYLTERYCLYAHEGDTLYRADVHHGRWPLQPTDLEIRENTLCQRLGFPLDEPPALTHYADRIDVVGWLPEVVSTDRE